MRSNKAFTIVELMIVVVIISIMASFGVPNFAKTINRAKAKDAINNLNIIHAANILYRSRAGANLSTAANLGAINTALTLNISANGSTYACDAANTCVATGPGSIFVATVSLNTPLSAANPSCPQGTYAACP